MNSTDYLVIAAIVLSAGVGAARGFLREAIAVAAWLIGLLIAWHFSDLIAPHLGGLLAQSDVRPWAARIIIMLLVLLFAAALGAVLGHFVRLSIFSGMDRLLGFLFGLVRGLVEVRRAQHLDDVRDGVLAEEHPAQDALLGGDVLRWGAFEGGVVRLCGQLGHTHRRDTPSPP